MIAIIDYGMGNIHSVQKALESMGAKTYVTNKPRDIQPSEKVVLPGVGAFSDALLELEKQGLIQAIREHINKNRIFLGICLGMQLLFDSSAESPGAKGPGILKGKVKKFAQQSGIKVPHMGWNQIRVDKPLCPILKGIPDNSYVYFCHSYYPQPKDRENAAATTDYGIEFASVVWQDNIFGVQFHPEKSQVIGLQILKNFIKL